MYVLPATMNSYYDESGSFTIVFCKEPGLEIDVSICATRQFRYRNITYTLYFNSCNTIEKGDCIHVVLS